MIRIGIVANEPSGDMLGAGLIEAIQNKLDDVEFEGVAGPLMLEKGCKTLFSMEKLSVMGLVEVLKHLPELLSLRKQLFNHFTSNPPDLFIGIDAPDFNLGLETRLREKGITTAHYVCPTVWAWRPKRVNKIRQAVDLMLSIFPFEVDFLRQHNVQAAYVGHPLADEIPLESDRDAARSKLNLKLDQPVLAILPGSRVGEVQTLTEVFLQTAISLRERQPTLQLVVPLVNQKTRDAFQAIKQAIAPELDIKITMDGARDALVASDLVLTASGTATLEAMLTKRPMVVAYRLNSLTHWIVTRFKLVKIPYVAMANLLAGEELAPEFIQDKATAENLSAALLEFLDNSERVSEVRDRYLELHKSLKQNSSEKAADAIIQLIGERS